MLEAFLSEVLIMNLNACQIIERKGLVDTIFANR